MKKYYIPTSSLNFNNILSTESISPKAFYGKRGFGYSRWWPIDENNMENITLLFDSPHMFERPSSDMEDHEMLIEINTDDEYNKLTDGVYYSDKTIYLNPWQTKIYFFSDSVKRTVLSLSDSSLETKMVRLYQRQMIVDSFDGKYPIIQDGITVNAVDTNRYIEEDYIINKMKGLLYGYYIGANLSSTKEQIQKLDSLREIQNIFSSIISSYDRVPSQSQRKRLNDLFEFLEHQQPLYLGLEKIVDSQELANKIFDYFKHHGYSFKTIDGDSLISGLQSATEYNPSIAWIKREISKADGLVESSKKPLNPEDAEIIVSSRDKLVSQKNISDELMAKLFVYWVNNVLCSDSFNGKVNSVKESLSDEITKAAKNVIGADWDNSPIRTYLNQLRRHVRGEEFNQEWDNGLLSSMAAILIKGDEWEQLLHFMQNKGMFDYRLAYAMYGVLNGFANMTRDFTDLLLNKQYGYLSGVYREFYGQLHKKYIPVSQTELNVVPIKEPNPVIHTILKKSETDMSIEQWREGIRKYAATVIKRDKSKLKKNSLEEALIQNGANQDYFAFITMLANFDGWKPSKSGSNTNWKRMQEHFIPDYNQQIGKNIKKKNTSKQLEIQEKTLFDELKDDAPQLTSYVKNAFVSTDNQNDSNMMVKSVSQTSSITTDLKGKSILKDTSWIEHCATFINDVKAKNQFIEDMNWFIDNYKETYYDKKKGPVKGYYFGYETSNVSVIEKLKTYIKNKRNSKDEDKKWLASIYKNIPIDKIMDYINDTYGN